MKILVAILFVLVALSANNLSFTNKPVVVTAKKTTAYTIVLFATKTLNYAQELIEKISSKFKDETHIYKSGKYYTARFAQSKSYSYLKPFVFLLQKAGFRGAYISELTFEQMQRELVEEKIVTKTKKKTKNKEKKRTKTISKFSRSSMILKANSAYKSGNEFEAIMYYEMLSASGYTNDKIKNNLCYLYGKRGAWSNAKALIENEKYQSKLLYAYAYGAVQSNQNDYYDNISPYIVLDRSGLLALLTASFFEKKEDMQRASFFYEMAYKKNPSNPYIVYSYARDADILHDREKAKKFYKEVLGKVGSEHQLYKIVKKRLLQIGA